MRLLGVEVKVGRQDLIEKGYELLQVVAGSFDYELFGETYIKHVHFELQ